MSGYFFAFIGSILGGLTVAIGAFGAHALKPVLDSYGTTIWNKAVFYQAIHSLALLSLPLFAEVMTPRAMNVTGYLFILGIVLFSGSLYVMAVSGIKILGAITPLGGVSFIVGWIWLSVALFKAAFRA